MTPAVTANRFLRLKIPPEFAALMDGLQLTGANSLSLQNLSDGEWSALLDIADPAHLTLSLSELCHAGFPQWVVERLARNAADNAERFERVKATYLEASVALKEAQIEFVVLKGFTQAPDYVTSGRLRMQSDIDLYCASETVAEASEALQGIGYKSEKKMDYSHADHAPALIRPGGWKWSGNAFDPTMPLSIELHFCLWNQSVTLFSLPEIDEFWSRRIVREVDGLEFPTLNAVDHLAYFALHILRSLLAGDWIVHHVYELARFLHSHASDDVFWDDWKRTHGISIRTLQALAFEHARAWFQCDLHHDATSAIADLSSGPGTWLHRFSGSALEGMFAPNKDFIWLHSALLASRKDKRHVIRRALIPDHVPRKGSPGIGTRRRQATIAAKSPTYIQYVLYLITRVISHVLSIPTALLGGLGWWASQRRLQRQFWIFLAASFFLTWAFQSTSFYSIFS